MQRTASHPDGDFLAPAGSGGGFDLVATDRWRQLRA
jgi:hypothetical protein